MTNHIVYSYGAVMNNSDADLLNKLKDAWGYNSNQKLRLIGRLEKIDNSKTGKSFFILSDLISVNDLSKLTYPIRQAESIRNSHNVFVPARHLKSIESEIRPGDLVVADVELSPREEREKRENPFALQTYSDLDVLTELPIDILKAIELNDKCFLEKRIVDFYTQKNRSEIEATKQQELARAEYEHADKLLEYRKNNKALADIILVSTAFCAIR